MTSLELAANFVTAVSIALAARNRVQTWPIGIVGCLLFGLEFMRTQLYADATLQLFFIATSIVGWWQWRAGSGRDRAGKSITQAMAGTLAWLALGALAVTIAYGALLHRYTDAYLPYVDAAVLGLSVVAQCLLMQRKLETWPAWLAVNTLSVPLFASRGLWLTAALYAAYWLNAIYGWWRWRQQATAGGAPLLQG